MKVTDTSIRKYLFAVGLFSSLIILKISDISIFLIVVYFTFVLLLIHQKIIIIIHSQYFPYIVCVLITCVLSCFLNLPSGYNSNNVKGAFNSIIVFLTATSLIASDEVRNNSDALLLGLKWSCRVQVIWIVLQYLLWNSLSLDINQTIFSDILGMVENASQYKGTGYIPTGLSWNAGGIAPIIFIGFFVENVLIWKLVIVVAALLTQSATLTIGIVLCALLSLAHAIAHFDSNKLKRYSIMTIITLIIVSFGLICIYNHNQDMIQNEINILRDSFSYRLNGLSGKSGVADSSTSAHLGYFVNLPSVIAFGGILQFLFGYGVNTSGYAYSAVTGQYSDQVWIVESDITNIFLNLGLIGFIAFYYWLLANVFKLFSKKSQLAPAFLIIAVMGVTYNLQYPWLVFIELVIFGLCEQLPGDSQK